MGIFPFVRVYWPLAAALCCVFPLDARDVGSRFSVTTNGISR